MIGGRMLISIFTAPLSHGRRKRSVKVSAILSNIPGGKDLQVSHLSGKSTNFCSHQTEKNKKYICASFCYSLHHFLTQVKVKQFEPTLHFCRRQTCVFKSVDIQEESNTPWSMNISSVYIFQRCLFPQIHYYFHGQIDNFTS